MLFDCLVKTKSYNELIYLQEAAFLRNILKSCFLLFLCYVKFFCVWMIV